MKYINEKDVRAMGTSWPEVFQAIRDATAAIRRNDYSQPLKPYLRYKDPRNRIIAMPAYLGGPFDTAGIKWIASFPGNIAKDIPRAHSVIILNEADTGVPYAIINTALVSAIRTAGVTGAVTDSYLAARKAPGKLTAGIIGMGPIGQMHLDMLNGAFAESIEKVLVYDLNEKVLSQVAATTGIPVERCGSWEEVFDQADIFMTCTVSGKRYIDRPPRAGALYLNVSLRDFEPAFMQAADLIVVDNWEEVCRENTDIEWMHLHHGLQEKDVATIGAVLLDGILADGPGRSVMFNPMGMSVYDMAVARYYYDLSASLAVGAVLENA
ncbi:2,3-diaminopropionate biosynthesis protein SbnB [Chitinophaga oryzae]|uniref:2,3-diaminopropionate biosynthesis protein SbnB n=1 Tax=Chitinophaga oryzae TaxID=2725414 RepID=A0ABX6LD88_9BACT|nr:2,3-diaminopropionate biosynthesis protein SbnB [Chitinophaga oryzae]QJB38084.1 2,3-diaminopropionate biosynthesis protein SbnB [Chitinophaga oryzae]